MPGLIDLPEITLIITTDYYLRPMLNELVRLDQFEFFGYICVIVSVAHINNMEIKFTIKPLYPIDEGSK